MNSDWKIYTRQGDQGQTSLLGGSKVPKYHERIEAYGTLDELNSFIGLVRDFSEEPHTRSYLKKIQDEVFAIESHLASETKESSSYLPAITGKIIGRWSMKSTAWKQHFRP
ncbi:MAG: ATP:cob(I)alamin adenosyltransferase [Bacteroidales bacterium]|nr:ATP:cob(I)alamin adenosyltransferase [Bacteroidales bacterium]